MTGEPEMVGGRYELGDLLGRGGMAEVRHAIDTRLGRPVAVKQLRADLATDPTFQARFRREAQSAAGLNHPTIVAVYDTGEETDQRTGVSIPYIVMELVEGPTLRDVLRDGRKILPERALELTQGVLDALSYSHKAGIVHRDIKPANVMLTPTGGVKVMDFGIARAVADTSATMTQTAAVIGTAQYLSPEQARGETVDARSDIYSAGCLLYELLVGRPPFVGESPVSVAYQHVREQPVPPSDLDPVITGDIDAVVLKALEKDRDTRYQSAREMKADISRLLAGQQVTAVVPAVADRDPDQTRVVPQTPVPAAAPEPDPPLPDPDLEDEEDEPKRRVGLGIFITVLILAILGGAAYGLYQWMQPPEPPPVQMVTVPAVEGFAEQRADSELRNAKLVPDIKKVNGKDDETKDTVTKQTPESGAEVKENSTVVLEVNVGPKTATIPNNLVGKDVDKVEKQLKEAGFTNITKEAAQDEPADADKDEVLGVTPGEGESAALDEDITVTFATGEAEMPSLLGANENGARQLLEQAGFRDQNVTIREEESDQPVGTVVDQKPKAGKMVARDAKITLTVAKAKPEPTPTPEDTPSPSPTPTDQTTEGKKPGDDEKTAPPGRGGETPKEPGEGGDDG